MAKKKDGIFGSSDTSSTGKKAKKPDNWNSTMTETDKLNQLAVLFPEVKEYLAS